jgi:hypothetical protein
MAVKLSKEDFNKLTKQELYDILTTYIKEAIDTSVRETRSKVSFDKPNWAEYQAYQLGYQQGLVKLLDYLP